jgi:hypothetical protein
MACKGKGGGHGGKYNEGGEVKNYRMVKDYNPRMAGSVPVYGKVTKSEREANKRTGQTTAKDYEAMLTKKNQTKQHPAGQRNKPVQTGPSINTAKTTASAAANTKKQLPETPATKSKALPYAGMAAGTTIAAIGTTSAMKNKSKTPKQGELFKKKETYSKKPKDKAKAKLEKQAKKMRKKTPKTPEPKQGELFKKKQLKQPNKVVKNARRIYKGAKNLAKKPTLPSLIMLGGLEAAEWTGKNVLRPMKNKAKDYIKSRKSKPKSPETPKTPKTPEQGDLFD